jgi:hypothetical protein
VLCPSRSGEKPAVKLACSDAPVASALVAPTSEVHASSAVTTARAAALPVRIVSIPAASVCGYVDSGPLRCTVVASLERWIVPLKASPVAWAPA